MTKALRHHPQTVHQQLTLQPSPSQQPANADSGNVFTPGVIVSAIFVVGVIVVVSVFFHYRIKMRREAREQLPDEALIRADIVVEPRSQPPGSNGTVEAAAAFLDPTSAVMAQAPAAAVMAKPIAGKELPRYKDQVRKVASGAVERNTRQQHQNQDHRRDPPEIIGQCRQLPTYKDQVYL
jgi:hypothetical protein